MQLIIIPLNILLGYNKRKVTTQIYLTFKTLKGTLPRPTKFYHHDFEQFPH